MYFMNGSVDNDISVPLLTHLKIRIGQLSKTVDKVMCLQEFLKHARNSKYMFENIIMPFS